MITIIVLLILAGVSIAMLTGENGILTKAQSAKEKNEIAQLEEQIKLAVLTSRMNNKNDGSIDKGILDDELAKITGASVTKGTDDAFPWTVTVGGYKFEITEDGDVDLKGESSSIALTGLTASNITVEKGSTAKIIVTKTPNDATEGLTYKSNDEAIATVDESGVVTGVSVGETTITIAGKITGVSTTCTVTVVAPGNPDTETGLFTKNSTINGGVASANNPTIPAGYRPIEVTTGQTPSSWGDGTSAPTEESVKNGLVITDGTSEFVWIPVEEINEMAREIEGAEVDANENKQYRGVLYNFASTLASNTEIAWSASSTSYREPAYLSSYDTESNVSGWTSTLYQEEYDKMVESVFRYKGFYVGRYETSLSNATSTSAGDGSAVVQSKGGVVSANASLTTTNKWYKLYTMSKTYAPESDTNKKVVSSMIWGSQYDAMMRWMQKNVEDVTSTTSSKLQNAERNTGNVTGGTSNKDIINNIYDLLGNRHEWTQEANSTYNRVYRGGRYNYGRSPSYCNGNYSPSNTNDGFGSRLTLYIK